MEEARCEVPGWAAGASRGLPVVEDVNAAAGGTPVDGTREQEAAQEVTEGETRTGALRRAAAVLAEEARRQVADALAEAVAAAAEDADAASGSGPAALEIIVI